MFQEPYSLVVKMGYLLPEDEVLEERWAPVSCSQAVLVADLPTDVVGQVTGTVVHGGIRNRSLRCTSSSCVKIGRVGERTASGRDKSL